MPGSAMMFVGGVIAIIVCALLWTFMSPAVRGIGDTMCVITGNDAEACAKMAIGQSLMEFGLLIIIIVIIAIMAREAMRQPGDANYAP